MKAGRRNSSDERAVRPRVSNGVIGLSLIGGGVAWTFHLLLAYLVAEFGCLSGLGDIHFLGITAVVWSLGVVTFLALAGAVGAVTLAYKMGGKVRGESGAGDREEGAGGFAARTALIVNWGFLIVILVESVPIFYFLREC